MHLMLPSYVNEHSPWAPQKTLFSGISHLYLHSGFPFLSQSKTSWCAHTFIGRTHVSKNKNEDVLEYNYFVR